MLIQLLLHTKSSYFDNNNNMYLSDQHLLQSMNQELLSHVCFHSCGWTKYFVIVPSVLDFVEQKLIRTIITSRGHIARRKVGQSVILIFYFILFTY